MEGHGRWKMDLERLSQVAKAMVARGRGILAADESHGTTKRRFDALQIESTAETRRSYREMLLSATGMEQFISGVILFDETLRQTTSDGTPFAEMLSGKGVIPGIKVDAGTTDLAGFSGEKVTGGLDGLSKRLAEYKQLGANFAKWRAVITIGPGMPSRACLLANAHGLARYAAICQAADVVPIVEPEVLMEGDHDIQRCEEVTTATLDLVFSQLLEQRVALEGMLLKPNMVLPGKKCPEQATPKEVAEATVRCFRRVVPAAVPGIVFLSGGQGPEEATSNLNAMNALGAFPWELSFSYGRALQEPSLKAWKGLAANVATGQRLFLHRARMNGAARFGKYSSELEVAV
jgi:fructose-bisphosphate aldolase class I